MFANFGFVFEFLFIFLVFKFTITGFYRYGTIFRQIYKSENMDYCGMMDGKKTNILLEAVIKYIKDSAPQYVHKCPYKKVRKCINLISSLIWLSFKGWKCLHFQGLYNITIVVDPSKFLSIYPSGRYKHINNITDKRKPFFTLEDEWDIKSEIRTSF